MVARQQHTIGRVPQAEVVDGVTGGVHGKPLTAGEVQRIAVDDPDRGLRRQEPLSACVGLDHSNDGVVGWRLSAGAPRRFAELFEAFLPEVDDLRFGHVRDQWLQIVVGFGGERGERFVGQDVGAGDLSQLGAATEVVGVGVGDDDRVHSLDRNLGLLQPGHERVPRLGAGESGVDEGDTVTVDEGIAVDVTEAGQRDRQLHPQDAIRDLRDLLGRGLLFLLRVGGGAHALQARRKCRGKRKAPAGSGAALRGSRGCRREHGGRRLFSAPS